MLSALCSVLIRISSFVLHCIFISYRPFVSLRRTFQSHGKISFKELSSMISSAWVSADSETREFCYRLAAIGMLEYKNKKNSRMHRSTTPLVPASPDKKEAVVAVVVSEELNSNKSTSSPSPSSIASSQYCGPCQTVTPVTTSSSGDSPRMRELVGEYISRLQNKIVKANRQQRSIKLVDMDDDDIMKLWNESPANDDNSMASVVFDQLFYSPPPSRGDALEGDGYSSVDEMSCGRGM